MSHRRLFWGLLAVLALVAGACGDSGDGAGSAQDPAGSQDSAAGAGADSTETGNEAP